MSVVVGERGPVYGRSITAISTVMSTIVTKLTRL